MNATIGKDVSGTKSGTARSVKRKILLVNDDRGMRRILSRLLVEEDFLVLTAANGDEAVKLSNMNRFDLVLLDLKSPLEGEWENLGQLAAANPLLPVLLITDRHSEYFHALASGIGALVEKPLNFVELFHTIHRLLGEPTEERRARFMGRPAAFHYIPSRTDKASEVWRAA